MKRLRRFWETVCAWWRIQKAISKAKRWHKRGHPAMAAKYTQLALAEIDLLKQQRRL